MGNKTLRCSKSLDEIRAKLTEWARTWDTFSKVQNQDHDINFRDKSLSFWITIDKHDPQQSPHAKDCPRNLFGSFVQCYQSCIDGDEEFLTNTSDQPKMPCSFEQQTRCDEFKHKTRINAFIEQRTYDRDPTSKTAIRLSNEGDALQREMKDITEFLFSLFGESVITTRPPKKHKGFQAPELRNLLPTTCIATQKPCLNPLTGEGLVTTESPCDECPKNSGTLDSYTQKGKVTT